MPMLREDSMMGPVREQRKIAVRRIGQRAKRRGGEREEGREKREERREIKLRLEQSLSLNC
jgi:hypothetical protein